MHLWRAMESVVESVWKYWKEKKNVSKRLLKITK